MKRPNAASVTVLLACFVSISVFAQTISGVVSGTVADTGGLAVPGAAVTLVDTATALRQSASSEASGDFVFPSVPPGVYNLVVEAKGFKRFEKTQVIVTASERVAAGTLRLQVGAISETITVSGEATPVQTASDERSAMGVGQTIAFCRLLRSRRCSRRGM
jgi:hypothetical protein